MQVWFDPPLVEAPTQGWPGVQVAARCLADDGKRVYEHKTKQLSVCATRLKSLVQGTLNTHEVKMLLDTGASTCFISQSLAHNCS